MSAPQPDGGPTLFGMFLVLCVFLTPFACCGLGVRLFMWGAGL